MAANTWNIGETVPINLFLLDVDTGLGLTGQTAYITLTIQRSDNLYWTGLAWGALTLLTMSEVDSTNAPGRYLYTLSAVGNNQADRYMCHAKVDNTGVLVGENFELHISRDLTSDQYAIEPA